MKKFSGETREEVIAFDKACHQTVEDCLDTLDRTGNFPDDMDIKVTVGTCTLVIPLHADAYDTLCQYLKAVAEDCE